MEAPIPLPASPAFAEFSWVKESAVARSDSPFSLTQQVYAWPGQRWSIILKLPAMSVEDGQAWEAFFGDLNGAEGCFFARESLFMQGQEIDLGTPELNGAHVSGSTILTRNWNPDRQILKKGQKIEIAGRIRQVLDDAYSDEGGNAALRVWPHCRSLPDGLPVIWYQPKGVFRAVSVPEFVWDKNRLLRGFQFSATECILP
jgi:hypothetical protein